MRPEVHEEVAGCLPKVPTKASGLLVIGLVAHNPPAHAPKALGIEAV